MTDFAIEQLHKYVCYGVGLIKGFVEEVKCRDSPYEWNLYSMDSRQI